MTGLRVCERHAELVARVPKLRRSPCTELPAGSSEVQCPQVKQGWRCHSLGCQVGLQRPCIVCGEGPDEPGNAAQKSARSSRSSSACGGMDSEGSDGSSGRGIARVVPCARAGCTAALHNECRRLLSQRVEIYWDEDDRWYWGSTNVEEVDEDGECEVRYDDGTKQHELLGEAAGDESEKCRWLVARRPGDKHSSVWKSACTCSKGVVVEAGPARDLEDDARCCAICCISDYRYKSEPGDVNHLIYCDGCGMCVHMFCYGMNAKGPMFGRQAVDSITFLCDVCEHLGPELITFGPGAPLAEPKSGKAARGARSVQPACSLCPQRGGALRLQLDGTWAHVSCVLYGRFDMSRAAAAHQTIRLCPRSSGCEICLRNSFRNGHCRALDVAKVKARGWRCSSPCCPDRTHTAGLVICGTGEGGPGCHRATHITCAQRPGSGWHMMLKDLDPDTTDAGTAVEITCSACNDLFLDVTGRKPVYRQLLPQLTGDVDKYVSDEAYAAAPFTFMDWAHGPCFGFTRVGHRAGGLCVGACDSDESARMQYVATFTNPNEPLTCISKMGTDERVARSATIIFCGFCCKPFSCAGKGRGFDDERFGNNFDLLAQALHQRKDQLKLWDPCLILENVPTLLNHLTLEHLQSLGYFCKIYVVSGSHFRCASTRLRLVLVAFRDKVALDRFRPPPPQSTAPTPLRTVLKNYSPATAHDLFIPANRFNMANDRSHVVGRGFSSGARSPTSACTMTTALCLRALPCLRRACSAPR